MKYDHPNNTPCFEEEAVGSLPWRLLRLLQRLLSIQASEAKIGALIEPKRFVFKTPF